MNDAFLYQLRVIMQRDVNHRGLGMVHGNNLLTACKDDFAAACQSLAETDKPKVGVITGFWIPAAKAAETDGPLGAIFLARVLHELGADVTLMAEEWCAEALRVGIREVGLEEEVVVGFPQSANPQAGDTPVVANSPVPLPRIHPRIGPKASTPALVSGFTHLIAIERVGPSHTWQSFFVQPREQPAPVDLFSRVPTEHYDHCHTMRGEIISEFMQPVHYYFAMKDLLGQTVTIGIGDGGNEIGMGKIPWEVIAANVPHGAITACRIATDHNLVCGVSNWGAYGLGVGVWKLAGKSGRSHLFNVEIERIIGEKIIAQANLVNGMTGQRTLTVDGLPWDVYSQPIAEMFSLLAD